MNLKPFFILFSFFIIKPWYHQIKYFLTSGKFNFFCYNENIISIILKLK